ncbi:hypothetical protein KAR91_56560 [Candidatus Pacearchaeota archaeon]|nr:hypothetical protein [Candidatus Pacearchaeota archaeon]
MSGKVIHITDELFIKVKEHCDILDISAGQWAREVLETALNNNTIPVTIKSKDISPVVKKELLNPSPSVKRDNDPWSCPPFWEEYD